MTIDGELIRENNDGTCRIIWFELILVLWLLRRFIDLLPFLILSDWLNYNSACHQNAEGSSLEIFFFLSFFFLLYNMTVSCRDMNKGDGDETRWMKRMNEWMNGQDG
jgi:hypothetical protein